MAGHRGNLDPFPLPPNGCSKEASPAIRGNWRKMTVGGSFDTIANRMYPPQSVLPGLHFPRAGRPAKALSVAMHVWSTPQIAAPYHTGWRYGIDISLFASGIERYIHYRTQQPLYRAIHLFPQHAPGDILSAGMCHWAQPHPITRHSLLGVSCLPTPTRL